MVVNLVRISCFPWCLLPTWEGSRLFLERARTECVKPPCSAASGMCWLPREHLALCGVLGSLTWTDTDAGASGTGLWILGVVSSFYQKAGLSPGFCFTTPALLPSPMFLSSHAACTAAVRSQDREDMDLLEPVQGSPPRCSEGWGTSAEEERLRDLVLVSLEDRRLWGDLTVALECLKGTHRKN